jgi:hypothetical protein
MGALIPVFYPFYPYSIGVMALIIILIDHSIVYAPVFFMHRLYHYSYASFPVSGRPDNFKKNKNIFLIANQLYLSCKQPEFSPESEKQAFILSFQKLCRV